MSGIGREVAAGVTERLDRFRGVTGRITAGPLLVRGAVFAFALAGLLVAVPAQLLTAPWAAGVPVLVAAVPAVLPRTGWPTAVILATVAAWLAATTVYAEPVVPTRLIMV